MMPATPEFIDVGPIARAAGEIDLPGSKSISIRALLLGALAPGSTELEGILDSDDTDVMRGALAALGVPQSSRGPGHVRISGARRFPRREAELFLGNSGLSARTLLAALAFMDGHYRLAGIARMHERPIGELVDALRQAGADIEYLGAEGFLPLRVGPCRARPIGPLWVRSGASSQYLTGLLQSAPLLSDAAPLHIILEGALISRPYVLLTLDLMRRFGVSAEGDPDAAQPAFVVPRGARYHSPGTYRIEADASSASYFLALGALAGGPVRVRGLGRASIQPDASFAATLEKMGAKLESGVDWIQASSPGVATGFRLKPVNQDFNHMPDAAMTVAILALFASGPSVLRNIGSWRVKETDRIAAMACELSKLGASVTAGSDFLRIVPPLALGRATIRTYDDHRMAMCFALAACGGSPVRILEPDCVRKTFPQYFDNLRSLLSAAKTVS